MVEALRRGIAAVARGPLAETTVAVVDRLAPRPRGVLSILTYHRVDEPLARPDLTPSLISASPSGFAAQMALIARRYDPVSLADVLDAVDHPDRLPRRAVLVTFDDGYRDFAQHAWPVLRAAAIPATLFVATAFASAPSTRFWWDRLWAAMRGTTRTEPLETPIGRLAVGPASAGRSVAVIRAWLKGLDHDAAMGQVDRIVEALDAPADPVAPAVLDWDELRTLASDGVTLAPHTREHPLLDRVPLDRAVAEVAGSRADLEREIGPIATVPPVLAYPSGAHGGTAVEAARAAGMVLALTTRRGGNDLRRADPMRLRRINVGGRAGVPLVRAQLVWAASVDARRTPG